MVEFKPTRGNLKLLLKSKQVEQRALMPVAEKLAPVMMAATPKSNRPGGGGTAASTFVQGGHRSLTGDRVAVHVGQTSYSGRNRPRGGAAAPLQEGNAITTRRGHMIKALKLIRLGKGG